MNTTHRIPNHSTVETPLPLTSLPATISVPFPPPIDEHDLKPEPRKGTRPVRATNRFLLYRKAIINTLRAQGYNYFGMRTVSKLASESWKTEPDTVRQEYQRLALEAKKLHGERFPSIRTEQKETTPLAQVATPALLPTADFTLFDHNMPAAPNHGFFPLGNIRDNMLCAAGQVHPTFSYAPVTSNPLMVFAPVTSNPLMVFAPENVGEVTQFYSGGFIDTSSTLGQYAMQEIEAQEKYAENGGEYGNIFLYSQNPVLHNIHY